MTNDPQALGQKLKDYIESGHKANCELCNETFPDALLMHLTRDKDSPICCTKCYFERTEKLSKLLFRKVK